MEYALTYAGGLQLSSPTYTVKASGINDQLYGPILQVHSVEELFCVGVKPSVYSNKRSILCGLFSIL